MKTLKNKFMGIEATNSVEIQRDATIELLSSRIHDIWGNWYTHQRDNSTPENIERWNKLSALWYDLLSEEDKEKDRKIVRKLLIDIS